MTHVKPRRIQLETGPAHVHVTIGPGRRLVDMFALIISATVVTGTVVGAVDWVRELPHGRPMPLAAIACLCVWFVGAVVCAAQLALTLLWRFVGREEFGVTNGYLVITVRLCWFRQSKSYVLSDIRDIRVAERRTRRFLRRTIAFKHFGRTVYSTSQLSTDEAGYLLDHLLNAVRTSSSKA